MVRKESAERREEPANLTLLEKLKAFCKPAVLTHQQPRHTHISFL
jgi:hypothetical protein